jgi:exonuclease SbcD
MRILHLADLHLGKLVHETPMTDDQAHVLEQILDIARQGAAEAVVICGDVYDRPVPPVAATRLMDDFLSRLVLDMGLPVVVIPGNHDSAERLGFGGRMLRARGLHIAPPLPGDIVPVTLADAHGPVTFYPLPYVSPLMLKEREDDLPGGDFDAAMARVVSRLPTAPGRSVCLAHCFTLGAAPSDSERPLSIGGADQVDAGHFARFDLALLGHLHRPQRAANNAFYAGSPLKYSFSEADHAKSVAFFDLAADGSFTREEVPLSPRRDLRILTGALDGLLAAAADDPGRDDYLWIALTDPGALFDYAAKLRQAYPNVLNITREAYRQAGEGGIEVRGKTEWEIARAFFLYAGGRELDAAEEAALRAAVDEMLRAEQAGERTAEAADGQPGESAAAGEVRP